MKKPCLIILFVLFASTVFAFDIEIQNNTDLKAVYRIYRVDHAFRDQIPGPVNIAGGELQPAKRWIIEDREPGIYIFAWCLYRDHVAVKDGSEQKRVGSEVKRVVFDITHRLQTE